MNTQFTTLHFIFQKTKTMKTFTLPFVIILMIMGFPSAGTTQTVEPLDSLKALLPEVKDTLKVEVLSKIAKNYIFLNQLDSCEYYTDLAKQELETSPIPSDKHEAAILVLRGNIAHQRRDLGESTVFHQKALELFVKIGDKRGESVALTNIGINYIMLEDHERALSYLYPSLRLSEEIDNKADIYNAYQNIAVVLSNMERNEEAKAYRLKILDYAYKTDNWYKIIYAAGSLAGNYKNMGVIDSALHYELIAYEKAKEVGNQVFEGRLLRSLSRTAILQERYEEALEYVELAFPLTDTSHYLDMAFVYNYDAEAKFGLGRYEEAFESAYKALAYAELDDHVVLLNNAYFQLYEFYKKRNQPEDALEYHELYKQMQDSVYNQEKNNKLQNMHMIYETASKESEIVRLQQETQIQELQLRQRNLWLLLLGGGALLIGTLGYFGYRQRILRKEFLLMQSEQRLLRTQMNPHFFFHALSSIQQFILKEAKKREAVLYLSKFSRLMRNVLEGSRTESVSLGAEIESISHYIELQQLRYGDCFDFSLHVDEDLDIEEWSFPPMLLQPVVENAIEHGLIPKKQSGKLHLSFEREAEHLHVVVEDNGIGRKETVPGTQPYRKSVALEVMKDRIALMNRRTKRKSSFIIIDLRDDDGEAAGTKVEFHLPLKSAI